jgi:hypothetical protein
VILSDEPILYPYVTQPHVLVVMSQEAYTRFAPELREGGLLIVEEELVHIDELRVVKQWCAVQVRSFRQFRKKPSFQAVDYKGESIQSPQQETRTARSCKSHYRKCLGLGAPGFPQQIPLRHFRSTLGTWTCGSKPARPAR